MAFLTPKRYDEHPRPLILSYYLLMWKSPPCPRTRAYRSTDTFCPAKSVGNLLEIRAESLKSARRSSRIKFCGILEEFFCPFYHNVQGKLFAFVICVLDLLNPVVDSLLAIWMTELR